MDNIITAVFGASREVKTNPVWRIDKGMQLRITGLDLPDYYQVHFANQPVQGEAIPVLASGEIVDIPDQYFQTGEDIYAWIYLTPAEGVGYTIRRVTIPVKARPDISGDEPTPEQESIIDQAIAALNTGVEAAESAAQAAQTAARNVSQSIDAALQEAKDSGEFDGPQGPKGDPGAQGPAGGNITVEETLISGEDYELEMDDNGEDLAGEIDELKSAIGDLANLTTTAKSNLVAAINEAAQSGGGGGGSTGGTMVVNDSNGVLDKTFQQILDAISDEIFVMIRRVSQIPIGYAYSFYYISSITSLSGTPQGDVYRIVSFSVDDFVSEYSANSPSDYPHTNE